MQRHLLAWLLLSVLLPGTALVFGCGAEGDRASTGGVCPDGEVCSDATPAGLFFAGATLRDSWLHYASILPVAVGGTQRISIRAADDRALPAFDAVTSTGAVAVEGVVDTTIEVRGTAAGMAQLRVVERASGRLLDRITIEARPIASASVATRGFAIAVAPMLRPTVYEPGEHTVAVQLADASGEVLIDESMTVDAGVPSTVVSWDMLTVTIPPTGLDLAVDAGGGAFTARVEPADAIDDIVLPTWLMDEAIDGTPERAAGSTVCALPLSRGAWAMSASSTTARFTLGDTVLEARLSGLAQHCALVPESASVGAAELAIEIAGVSRTFAITVTPGSGAASSSLVSSDPGETGAPSRARGDRARSMLTH